MAYKIEFRPGAARDLKKLPKEVARRIVSKVETLAEDPRPHGAEKLQSPDDLYRVRVGDYRIIYQIFDRQLLVLVVKIGDRKDVYKR